MADSTGSLDNASISNNTSSTPLRRARVACKACNTRRVRCDAADGQPCWHCRIRQTPCELIESRRGKYVRKTPRLPRGTTRVSQQSREITTTSDGHRISPETEVAPPCQDADAFPRRILPRQAAQYQTPTTPTPTTTTPTAQGQQPEEAEPRTTIPGDSSGVSYVVEVVYTSRGGIPRPLKVHYPIPASIADPTAPSSSHGSSRVEEPVSLQEALTMPPPSVADKLIHTFFSIIHPAYPVLDRSDFSTKYRQGKASPMVLHAIFLLAFTIGSESLVHEAGYSDRATARRTHFLRAKALYDADYDEDRLNVAVTLLLLGFWWTSPEGQKNNCYWVACAVTVAQISGMHRSTVSSVVHPRVKSLRKRIWWSIYVMLFRPSGRLMFRDTKTAQVRDRHTSAAFGRPCRIRDEDCDVEPLTREDFCFDQDYDTRLIPAQEEFHVSYAMEMARLATILGDILVGEFSPRREPNDKFQTDALVARLMQWESTLPESLRRTPPDGSLGASFWANMLHFAYQNNYILLFRPKTIDSMSPVEAERDTRARLAADSITRMAEDLLATGGIHSTHVHLVPALFGALSIHTLVICRKDPIHQQLAENKARQCILALSVLAKSWPVKIWIAKAHVNLMRRLTGQGGSSSGSIVDVSARISSTGSNIAAAEVVEMPRLHRAVSPRGVVFGEGTQLVPPHQEHERASRVDTRVHFPTPDHVPQAADQFVYDSLTAGYLDNIFDIDMFLRSGLGTPAGANVEPNEQDGSGL
ncbi:hypothetical protein FE257_004229 [Aspergillus nanangensis]|uniref:Zn(2)-C6 fungal-type domain-containing protein n=1 Tax=Aspergillus nanangensis TaxID=2582783 RepID=A0AAD4GXB1_ASPNN|nr:hypothetical protein FE257_004229 [Aspergillus nanangensis]